jgi:hypothetical protein
MQVGEAKAGDVGDAADDTGVETGMFLLSMGRGGEC